MLDHRLHDDEPTITTSPRSETRYPAMKAPRGRWRLAAVTSAAGLLLSGCTGGGPLGNSQSGDGQAAEATTTLGASTPPASELTNTLLGWSNADVPGTDAEVFGTWMARDSWENLEFGQWLVDNPFYVDYVAQHPDGAADIGVPLVPHDSDDDLNDMLEEVSSGDRDDVYLSMGEELARSGPATVYARVWWEMNLNPMAEGIDRGAFIEAWDHAVPLIREGFAAAAAPGQRMEIVFSPNADGADYREFYPDDSNVDMMALDAYGQRWGSETPSAGELLELLDSQLTQFSDFAREHDKPVAMAEWGNVAIKEDGGGDQMQGRGDFPAYVNLVLEWAAREDAVYLLYFNSEEGGVGQTLSDTPESLAVLQSIWV